MSNVSEHGSFETYMIQGAEPNVNLTTPFLEQIEAMNNIGAPEFVVDQGMYYPAATNYGYYCTGFESPSEWEDHHSFFGLDGPEFQYAGSQTESLPYVYYTPSYGYAESPYNPYNPYIPGAMIGVDGSFVGAQQYYTVPSYQDPLSSPAYAPFIIQPEIFPNSSLISDASIANRSDARGPKHNLSSAPPAFASKPPKPASKQTNLYNSAPETSRTNVGSSKPLLGHGTVPSGMLSNAASSHALQGKNFSGRTQALDSISNGKLMSQRNQLKVSLPVANGFSEFRSSANARVTLEKSRSKTQLSRAVSDVNGSSDALDEQNRGPRTNRSKNQLAVKGHTTKAADSNELGNIIIYTDQYNRDDFPVDYSDAKFFVIKSYSEDDVHKSIKYNVWSSTHHGNRKLDTAYEDAQRIAAGKPVGCPIFLFFSVNASGQFCGVAEMVGPVDHHKDMDFWQQDKWSGSFPVKWHLIKDVPNTSCRRIILENNENKPVTNSRDTQEILYKQGLEMLKIFKSHTHKTSILDDFTYYEERQKIMQEEKSRLLKNIRSPIFIPVLDSSQKLNYVAISPNNDERHIKANGLNNKETPIKSLVTKVSSNSDSLEASSKIEDTEQITGEAKDKITSTLNFGSLAINPKQGESKPLASAIPVTNMEPKIVDVVTVGSMPVKVNGFAESSGLLRVGTIPLDPRALQLDKKGSQR